MTGNGSLRGLKLSKSCSPEEEEEEEEEEEIVVVVVVVVIVVVVAVKEARQILLSMNYFNGEKFYTYHGIDPQHQRFAALRR
jgi:hypothetical protein